MKDAVALYSSPTNPLPSSQPSRASTTLSWILPIHSFASFSRLLRISKILEAIIISAARSQVPQITTNSTKIFVISFFANLFVLYCYSPPFLYIFFFSLASLAIVSSPFSAVFGFQFPLYVTFPGVVDSGPAFFVSCALSSFPLLLLFSRNPCPAFVYCTYLNLIPLFRLSLYQKLIWILFEAHISSHQSYLAYL